MKQNRQKASGNTTFILQPAKGTIVKAIDKLSIAIFGLIIFLRGYRLTVAHSPRELADAHKLFDEDGIRFPAEIEDDLTRFSNGAVNIVAYYRNEPVGMVRIANPKIANRAYAHLGMDKEGAHHEIQGLIVKKEHRDGAQFVMLGLVRKLYTYSVANKIRTWNACGKRELYLTIRRYCKKTEVIEVDFKSIQHPVTRYLYTHGKLETYFIMDLLGFSPSLILMNFLKKHIKSLRRERIPGRSTAPGAILRTQS